MCPNKQRNKQDLWGAPSHISTKHSRHSTATLPYYFVGSSVTWQGIRNSALWAAFVLNDLTQLQQTVLVPVPLKWCIAAIRKCQGLSKQRHHQNILWASPWQREMYFSWKSAGNCTNKLVVRIHHFFTPVKFLSLSEGAPMYFEQYYEVLHTSTGSEKVKGSTQCPEHSKMYGYFLNL